MHLIQGSLVCQFLVLLWGALYGLYDNSLLARAVRASAAWWKRWWSGSVLAWFFFARDGVLTSAWRDSRLCRGLNLLVNLPAALLHWLYRSLRPVWDDSFAAQLVFGLGEQVPAATGWVMLAIMIIPYGQWSNTYSLIGFVLLFLLSIAGGMRRRSLRLDTGPVGAWFLLYFAAVCLSWPLSMFPALSARYLPYHITCALCVLTVVSTVEEEKQLVRLAGFGCLGMGAASVEGILQRLGGLEMDRSYVDLSLNADLPSRIFSAYENPNAFAEVLVFLIPVAVGLLLGARSLWWKLVGLGTAGLGGLALIMTYSRGSWVGLAVAGVVFVFLWNRKLLPMFIALALLCVPFLPDHVLNRLLTIFNSGDTSTSSRVPLWEAAIGVLQRSPVTGAGLGGDAGRAAVRELGTFHGSRGAFTHSHNVYLQLWLEHGLLGVAAFLAGCCNAVKRGAKASALSACPPQARLVIIGAAAAVCGSLVSGMADYLFTYPRVMLIFWFTVSLLLAGVRMSGQSRTPSGARP